MAVESRFIDLMAWLGRPNLDAHLNLYPHAIEIQERTEVLGPDGDPSNPENPAAWTTFALANAKVSSESGETIVRGTGQPVGGQTVTFELLAVEGITNRMQVLWNGRTFGIEAIVDPGLRGIYTVLTCVEREVENE